MMSMNLSNIAILNIKGSVYCSIFSLISKNGAMKLMQNADFTIKSETSWNINNLFSCIKMNEEILKSGNIEIQKNKFYHYKTPIIFEDLDIEKVLVSNKISSGKKKL